MMIINTHIVIIIMTTIIRIMASTEQQLFSTYSTRQIPSPTSQSLPLPLPLPLLPIPLSITTTTYSLFYIYHIFPFILQCWERMSWFIRNLFLNLICHCHTTFPTHVVTKGTLLSLSRSWQSFFLLKNFQISTDFLSITRIPLLLTFMVGELKHYMLDFASVNFTSLSHNPGEKSVSVSKVLCVSQSVA
jgi:hypothetical protein